jgi:hypothetical protein
MRFLFRVSPNKLITQPSAMDSSDAERFYPVDFIEKFFGQPRLLFYCGFKQIHNNFKQKVILGNIPGSPLDRKSTFNPKSTA